MAGTFSPDRNSSSYPPARPPFLKGFQSTIGAGYKIVETQSTTLFATGGVRYLYLDGKVRVDARDSFLGNPIGNQVVKDEESGGNWDAVVGLRGNTRFNEKWYMSYYGDIGTGDSDLTWQAMAALFYHLKKSRSWRGLQIS